MKERETEYGKGDAERTTMSKKGKDTIEKCFGPWKPRTAKEIEKEGKFRKVYK